jgi:hypothetical protein
MKTTLTVDVEFDPNVTDAESIASAADRLLKAALSTPGIMDEYANPRFAPLFVAPDMNSSSQSRATVVLEISGGVMQEAYSTDHKISVQLVDWDCDGLQPDPESRVFAVNSVDGPTRLAVVTKFATVAMDQLSSDTRQALRRAGLEPDEQPEELHRRWVLYDMDSDSLLCTMAYDSYEEAADDAAQANDILVVPLVIRGITL